MERSYREIDNFLEPEYFNTLLKKLRALDFPWCYRNEQSFQDSCYYVHTFFDWYAVTSDWFEDIKPILDKLEIKMLSQVKAVLYNKIDDHIKHGFIRDRDFDCKTAILQMTTTNGWTIIGDDRIESEENKLIIFDSKNKYQHIRQTNKVRRIDIHINYV